MLNGEKVDALSAIVHRDKAYDWGKRLCEKLRKLLPRQMFEIAIQASIGTKDHCQRKCECIEKKCSGQVLWWRYYQEKKASGKAEKRVRKE